MNSTRTALSLSTLCKYIYIYRIYPYFTCTARTYSKCFLMSWESRTEVSTFPSQSWKQEASVALETAIPDVQVPQPLLQIKNILSQMRAFSLPRNMPFDPSLGHPSSENRLSMPNLLGSNNGKVAWFPQFVGYNMIPCKFDSEPGSCPHAINLSGDFGVKAATANPSDGYTLRLVKETFLNFSKSLSLRRNCTDQWKFYGLLWYHFIHQTPMVLRP